MTLLHWAAPTMPRPTRARNWPGPFRPVSQSRGKFPPFAGAAPRHDSDQPAVGQRGRCCRGGSLAPRVLLGTGLIARGLP
jgi:hypothetical protein